MTSESLLCLHWLLSLMFVTTEEISTIKQLNLNRENVTGNRHLILSLIICLPVPVVDHEVVLDDLPVPGAVHVQVVAHLLLLPPDGQLVHVPEEVEKR